MVAARTAHATPPHAAHANLSSIMETSSSRSGGSSSRSAGGSSSSSSNSSSPGAMRRGDDDGRKKNEPVVHSPEELQSVRTSVQAAVTHLLACGEDNNNDGIKSSPRRRRFVALLALPTSDGDDDDEEKKCLNISQAAMETLTTMREQQDVCGFEVEMHRLFKTGRMELQLLFAREQQEQQQQKVVNDTAMKPTTHNMIAEEKERIKLSFEQTDEEFFSQEPPPHAESEEEEEEEEEASTPMFIRAPTPSSLAAAAQHISPGLESVYDSEESDLEEEEEESVFLATNDDVKGLEDLTISIDTLEFDADLAAASAQKPDNKERVELEDDYCEEENGYCHAILSTPTRPPPPAPKMTVVKSNSNNDDDDDLCWAKEMKFLSSSSSSTTKNTPKQQQEEMFETPPSTHRTVVEEEDSTTERTKMGKQVLSEFDEDIISALQSQMALAVAASNAAISTLESRADRAEKDLVSLKTDLVRLLGDIRLKVRDAMH